MQRIRVYIIHNHQILVDVLAESMGNHPDVQLAGTATEVEEFASTTGSQQVDILLIGPVFQDRAVSLYIPELRARRPRLKIVPMGLVTEEQILECIEAGASGYVVEDASFDQLIATIRGVYRNQAPCSARVAASVSARLAQLTIEYDEQSTVRLPEGVKLTPKEEQVLWLAAKGLSNKEIASQLEIALSTVKFHIHRILGKLQVRKRREAIQLAFEAGLLR